MKNLIKKIYLIIRKYSLIVLISQFLPEDDIQPESKEDISKILFIRIDRIGDLVLSVPTIKAIKKAFPSAQLSVMTSHSNHSILMNNPYVDAVIMCDSREGIKEKINFLRGLKRKNFDLVIDPYIGYELKTAWIAYFSHAPIRIGYRSYGREVFFNRTVSMNAEEQHFLDLTLRILEPLSIGQTERRPELFLEIEEKEWAREWLIKNGMGNKPIVGIHPGAHYKSQRWPPVKFAELAKHLLTDGDIDVILFGGPKDENLISEIQAAAIENFTHFSTHNLRRFVALLSCCTALVCNNSGPLHMAVALNVPTVSTMGPTNPNRWKPLGEIHQVIRIDDLSCIGCNLGYCKIGTHDCMNLISPAMVIDALSRILAKDPMVPN